MTEEIKTEEIKTEEIKTEEIKTEEIKTEEIKTEEIKTEEIKFVFGKNKFGIAFADLENHSVYYKAKKYPLVGFSERDTFNPGHISEDYYESARYIVAKSICPLTNQLVNRYFRITD